MDDEQVQELPEMTEEERARLVSALTRMVELGMGAAYGYEEPGEPEALPDCASRLNECRARCCTLNFALTREEVEAGAIRHDPKRPYFISRSEDGYCTHLDRESLRCTEWDRRPLRCRRYDCSKDEIQDDC